jgi:hypothetical protein
VNAGPGPKNSDIFARDTSLKISHLDDILHGVSKLRVELSGGFRAEVVVFNHLKEGAISLV